MPQKDQGAQRAPQTFVESAGEERRPGEAKSPVESLKGGNRRGLSKNSGSPPAELRDRMSLNELADLLRKVNLTFDLFEIQAIYSVDHESGEVTVKVINQRTGEVIRKIPPYDLPKIIKALENERLVNGSSPEGLITDIKA